MEQTLVREQGQLKVFKSENDGYTIKSSKTGFEYDLNELISYGGKTTSDICMVLIYDTWTDENGEECTDQIGVLDYTYGASDEEATISEVLEQIEHFEEGYKAPLDIKPLESIRERIEQFNKPGFELFYKILRDTYTSQNLNFHLEFDKYYRN